jgi:hypothetical protein
MEIFEEDDDFASEEDTREMVLSGHHSNGLQISYDWTHRHPEDQADITAISNILGTSPKYDVKKSADPISLITLGGAFVLVGIVSGFLNQIGSDAWKAIRPRLAALLTRQPA